MDRMAGRPSTYTEEIGSRICERLVRGESIKGMCAGDDMPNASTVYVWLDRHPAFAEKYARARASATEAMLEDLLEIADKEGLNTDEKRVRIDARKWAMSKLQPKKYGDRQQVEHTGADGAPIEIASTVGLAVAAARELRSLRMSGQALPAPAEALPAPDKGEDLL